MAAVKSISFGSGASIATPTTLPGADQVRTYGLDGLGNWKTSNFTLVGSGGSTTSTAEVRQHNYVNEITTIRDTTGGTPTTTPFTYDYGNNANHLQGNGNLVNDGIRIYQYDAFNRVIKISKVSGGATLATYTYDAYNRRISKTIVNLSGGFGGLTGDIPAGTTYYYYNGEQIVEEQSPTTGVWTQVYFWGQYIDELLFFVVPTATTYRVLSDLLYRSTAIVTTSNAITEAYDCDAYGNTLIYSGPGTDGIWFTNDDVRTNSPINTTIFTGRLYDPESQIYYYRARYYSSQIGRFISRDPFGSPIETYARNRAYKLSVVDKSLLHLTLGMTVSSWNYLFHLEQLRSEPMTTSELIQGPSLYEYAWDNPTNKVDPTGLQQLPMSIGPAAGGPGPVLLPTSNPNLVFNPNPNLIPNPNPSPSDSTPCPTFHETMARIGVLAGGTAFGLGIVDVGTLGLDVPGDIAALGFAGVAVTADVLAWISE